jgi:hypothetical protein
MGWCKIERRQLFVFIKPKSVFADELAEALETLLVPVRVADVSSNELRVLVRVSELISFDIYLLSNTTLSSNQTDIDEGEEKPVI